MYAPLLAVLAVLAVLALSLGTVCGFSSAVLCCAVLCSTVTVQWSPVQYIAAPALLPRRWLARTHERTYTPPSPRKKSKGVRVRREAGGGSGRCGLVSCCTTLRLFCRDLVCTALFRPALSCVFCARQTVVLPLYYHLKTSCLVVVGERCVYMRVPGLTLHNFP